MNTRTRWIIGLLLAVVVGLAVGLVIVAADDTPSTTVTVSGTTDSLRSETTTLPTVTQTEPGNGGVTSPGTDGGSPGGSGGLGVSPPQ
jgi:hypothetical protein